MSSDSWVFLIGVVLAALALDGLLIWRWRQRKKIHPPDIPPSPPLSAKILITAERFPSSDITASRVVVMTPAQKTAPSKWSGVARIFSHPSLITLSRWRIFSRPDILLLSCAAIFYLGTRLYGITAYPIFFHSDEAIHSVLASELIRDQGVFEQKTFLPSYFPNGGKYNLSLSVYAQLLPVWLFGKSVALARGSSALLTLLPAIVVALIIRDFLKLPYSWIATFVLGLAPAWFLHSRTGFETVMATSLYAGFLYFYLRYRNHEPKHLYTALIFGALTFYAYSPAQMVIVLCGLALLIADFRYHLMHWKTGLRGFVLLFLLTLPYIRFRLAIPQAIEDHLRDLGSFWLIQAPLTEKLAQFWREYTYGLSIGYWYNYNLTDLPRHQMGDYGHLLRATLPFAVIGLGVAIHQLFSKGVEALSGIFRKDLAKTSIPVHEGEQSPDEMSPFPRSDIAITNDLSRITYRTLMIALLIAPLPGTLAQIGITRVLTFIIPITILTAVGVIVCVKWLGKWLPVGLVAAGAGLFLAAGTLFLTRDALTNGPFWHRDYTLGGMQYGAEQVMTEIQNYLDAYNAITVVMSPDWANGTEVLARFFLPGPKNIEILGANSFLYEVRPLPPTHLLVFTAAEYRDVVQSGKFKDIVIEKTILWPDGKPGFYFLRMQYVENIREILAQETEALHALLGGNIHLDGMVVPVRYSMLDMGTIDMAFDGRDSTLIRTAQVNPAVIELLLPEPRTYRTISVNVGASKIRLTVKLYSTLERQPIVVSHEAVALLEAPIVIMDFGQAVEAQMIRVEVLLLETNERAFVHLWEVQLK